MTEFLIQINASCDLALVHFGNLKDFPLSQKFRFIEALKLIFDMGFTYIQPLDVRSLYKPKDQFHLKRINIHLQTVMSSLTVFMVMLWTVLGQFKNIWNSTLVV